MLNAPNHSTGIEPAPPGGPAGYPGGATGRTVAVVDVPASPVNPAVMVVLVHGAYPIQVAPRRAASLLGSPVLAVPTTGPVRLALVRCPRVASANANHDRQFNSIELNPYEGQ